MKKASNVTVVEVAGGHPPILTHTTIPGPQVS